MTLLRLLVPHFHNQLIHVMFQYEQVHAMSDDLEGLLLHIYPLLVQLSAMCFRYNTF